MGRKEYHVEIDSDEEEEEGLDEVEEDGDEGEEEDAYV